MPPPASTPCSGSGYSSAAPCCWHRSFPRSRAGAPVPGSLHEPFWLVWRTRFFANVLTQLTLVPSIVTVITVVSAWRSGTGRRRYVEVALLAVATVTVGIIVLVEPI